MIAEKLKGTSSRVIRTIQLTLVLTSTILAVVFIRYDLTAFAKVFTRDFEQQNYVEISRGETLALARKLGPLTKDQRFVCTIGTKAGTKFFEERKGECSDGFLSVRNEIIEKNNDIRIEFFLAPLEEMKWGLVLFLLTQGLLAVLVFLSQRQIFFQQHQFEFDLAAMARQVGHDIRSPLAALSMLESNAAEDKVANARLRRESLTRLKNLVSSLIGEVNTETHEQIGDWLGTLVEEKQIEYIDSKVSIGAVWSKDLKSVVLPGDSYMWRRVVSNLVNNAVEACGDMAGSVAIEAERCAEGISLAILDNGKGIPAEVMGKMGQRGFIFDKEGGMGLGVFGAKEFVESLGGQLIISSQSTGGTKVTLVVPPISQNVVLIEDDLKLAELWKLSGEKKEISVRHFAKPEDFNLEKASIPRTTPIYLDLHFHDSTLNPIEFGEALRKEGFSELFICSGKDRKELSKIRWAKGICGKEPPWL